MPTCDQTLLQRREASLEWAKVQKVFEWILIPLRYHQPRSKILWLSEVQESLVVRRKYQALWRPPCPKHKLWLWVSYCLDIFRSLVLHPAAHTKLRVLCCLSNQQLRFIPARWKSEGDIFGESYGDFHRTKNIDRARFIWRRKFCRFRSKQASGMGHQTDWWCLKCLRGIDWPTSISLRHSFYLDANRPERNWSTVC